MGIGQWRLRRAPIDKFATIAASVALCLTIAGPVVAHEPQTTSGTPSHPAGSTLSERIRGGVYEGLTSATDGPCRGGFQVGRLVRALCTHGPDLAPQGVDITVRRSVAQLAAALPQTASAQSVPCFDDGVSGSRIQAIYAVASDRVDRFSTVAPLIRAYAALMDNEVVASAAETGGVRHIAFVTAADCTLDIAHVVVSPQGDDTLAATITELQAQGFDKAGRKYHIWMDSNVYCGIGTVANDDTAGPTNANESSISYGRSDNGCWNHAELHEVFHNLGAVQLSAPHSSGGWHCTDESDRMCYNDGGDTMTSPCAASHERLLDCGHDDYFHTDPAPGSYLATHWNTADSSFLRDSDSDPATPIPVPPANDDVALARKVVGARFRAVVDTRAATVRTNEPQPKSAGCHPPLGNTVWFRFRARAGANLVVNTRGSTFDTIIAVYRGRPDGSLARMRCNDTNNGSPQARVSFGAAPRTTYWFQIGGRGTSSGELDFTVKRK